MQEAIILVGGKGTRLRPLTNHTPKPLLGVAGSSFIRHQIAKLMDAGVEHVVFATSYLADLFEEEFKDFTQDLEISYAVEEMPLGTGGGDPQRGPAAARRFAGRAGPRSSTATSSPASICAASWSGTRGGSRT